jgi:hypothetical protein
LNIWHHKHLWRKAHTLERWMNDWLESLDGFDWPSREEIQALLEVNSHYDPSFRWGFDKDRKFCILIGDPDDRVWEF